MSEAVHSPSNGPPREAPTERSGVDPENPWPGLSSFTEDARGFFFGREKETEELFRLVGRHTLTVLFGQSGLGKSSLIHAGLFPRLRESDHLPLYLRLDHDPASPPLADQVKAALNDAFKKERAEAPAFSTGETLWEYFHRKDVDIWSAKQRLLTPILAFDQFEEMFTLGRADDARRERSRAFLSELACLVENRPPPAVQARLDAGTLEPAKFNYNNPSCRVILSLREDFLPDLEGLKQQMPALVHNRLRLKRLSGTQAFEIVARPAPQLLAGGVAERIVEFVAGGRGGSAEALAELEVEPALLSVVCRELNGRRKTEGRGQITADQVAGDRREILADFYERSVTDLPEPMRHFVEDRLLTKSGYRDNLALESALEIPGVTRPLIDALVSRRLLRIEDRLGVQRVELTHDVLAEVIRGSRDARMQRQEIERVREHERLILAGARRRARRQRWLIAVLGVIVVTLVLGGAFGLRRERLAAVRASQSDVQLASRMIEEGKISDGLAYLVRAAKRDPDNPFLASRILSTLVGRDFLLPDGAPLALPAPPVPTPVRGFPRYTSDGTLLLVQTENGAIQVIDAEAWRVARELRFRADVIPGFWTLAGNNDHVLAAGLEDGSIVVCDPATGVTLQQVQPGEAMPGQAFLPTLSPDGKWLLAVDSLDQGSVWIWNVGNGRLHARVSTTRRRAAFLPDSRRFVVTTGAINGTAGTYQVRSVEDGAMLGAELPAVITRMLVLAPDGRSVLRVAGNPLSFLSSNLETGATRSLPIAAPGQLAVVTPDGQRVVMLSDRAVYVVDAVTGKTLFGPLEHGGPVYAPVLSRDGSVLLTTSSDGLARIWSMETGKLLAEPILQQPGYAPAALSPAGDAIALFSTAGSAYRLRLGQGSLRPLVLAHREAHASAWFLPDQPHRLVRILSEGSEARDADSGAVAPGGLKFPEPLSAGSSGSSFIRVAATGDQGVIVARQQGIVGGNTWWLWRRGADGTLAAGTTVESAPVNPSWAISPDRELLAAAGNTVPNGKLLVWNAVTGKRLQVISHETQIIGGLGVMAFSPDSRSIGFLTSGGILQIRDARTGREQHEFRVPAAEGVFQWLFTADGSLVVASDSWGGLYAWNLASNKQIWNSKPHRDRTFLVLSRDGTRLLSSSADGSAQVWDLPAFAPRGAPLNHGGTINAEAFSPDGTRVATSGAGILRFWDASTGQPISEPVRLRGGDEALHSGGFSPDGRFIVTRFGSIDGTRRYALYPAPLQGDLGAAPDWLLRVASIVASKRLNEDGTFTSTAAEMGQLAGIRRELALLPATAPYVEWARWFLADRTTRPIAPGFAIAAADAERLAAEPGSDSLGSLAVQDNLLLQHDPAAAEAFERATLSKVRVDYGAESLVHASWQLRLATSLLRRGEYGESEGLARAAGAVIQRLRMSATGEPEVLGLTGAALAGQERHEEALPLLTEAVGTLGARIASGDGLGTEPRARTSAIWLIAAEALTSVYEATDQTESAFALRTKIEEFLAARARE